MTLGELASAGDLLGRARELSEGADFTDSDRADVLYRLAANRLHTAASLLPKVKWGLLGLHEGW